MPALESLRTLIKTSTSSMTAVPKPLKFLRPFYQELISTFEGFDESKLENERVRTRLRRSFHIRIAH